MGRDSKKNIFYYTSSIFSYYRQRDVWLSVAREAWWLRGTRGEAKVLDEIAGSSLKTQNLKKKRQEGIIMENVLYDGDF